MVGSGGAWASEESWWPGRSGLGLWGGGGSASEGRGLCHWPVATVLSQLHLFNQCRE